MRKIITILLFFTSFYSYSQESKEELKVHEINGKEYYIHVVDSGNTLYAISRRYAIPIEKLKEENPRLSTSLTIGDRLLIPLDEIKRRDLDESPEMDGNFLIYEVQKKNTLYSLAKEYHVEVNDIIAQNPQVEEGLKKGMKIRIPVAKIKGNPEESQYIVPAEVSPFITHMVLPKETLYSLSKEYKVSIDSILMVNNQLPGGLKVNQLINIPILKVYKDSSIKEEVVFDSSAVKPNYKVALLLPFYLDLLKEAADTSHFRTKQLTKELHTKAKYGIEFYQGFILAVDSLIDQGLNLTLEVYDTANDSTKAAKLISDSLLNDADLIIGPLYLDNFLMISDFAKMNNISIVSPVKLSNKVLLGNNYVSKVVTSDPVLHRFLGNYLFHSLRDSNLIMVYPDHFEDRKRAELVKKEYYEAAQTVKDSAQVKPLVELLFDVKNFSALKSKFDSSRTNVLVVPTKDQAFVTQLLTMLNMEDEFSFQVYGLPEWEGYDNIEIDYLQNLDVHLLLSEFIDHNSEKVKKFENDFYAKYELIPEKFSYLGFDVGYYYLGLLNDYGVNFEYMYMGVEAELLSRKFEFFKTGIESGYENHSTYIIRYNNFQKERVY
ncbi:MAG: LysM peptidoglycan-binding domain-containing protein [Vicingaceae bacterium]